MVLSTNYKSYHNLELKTDLAKQDREILVKWLCTSTHMYDILCAYMYGAIDIFKMNCDDF